jgi:hypothetical protein
MTETASGALGLGFSYDLPKTYPLEFLQGYWNFIERLAFCKIGLI